MTTIQHPIKLITQYYRCGDDARQGEIDTCLQKNLENPFIGTIHLLTEEYFEFSSFPERNKIVQHIIGERLTFAHAFNYANEFDPQGESVWVLGNADIYFDETLQRVDWENLDGVVYALTRHDMRSDGSTELVAPEIAHGCQDAWIFRAPLSFAPENTAFPLGVAGCDNRIAYELSQAGYALVNPCLTIHAIHLDICSRKNTHAKTAEYSANQNAEGYRLGMVVSPPYLYCLYPTDKLATPDPFLARQHLLASSRAFLRENELQDLLEAERRMVASLQGQLAEARSTIYSLTNDVAYKDQLITAQRNRISGLESSLSWRVTRPVRLLGEKLAPLVQSGKMLGTTLDAGKLRELAERHPRSRTRILLLDFVLGGGSNLYSRQLVANLEVFGHQVLTVSYRYDSRDYQLHGKLDNEEVQLTFGGRFTELFPKVTRMLHIDLVFVSQLVSWPETAQTLSCIRRAGIPYAVLIHDQFMICPNWTLFDYQGKFCGIPADHSICTECLAKLTGLDVPISQHTQKKEIKSWRKSAGAFLESAVQAICFSDASCKLIQKAYPVLDNVVVNEHFLPEQQLFQWRPRALDAGKSLNIAVLGAINPAKGSTVVESLFNSAEIKSFTGRFVLFGAIPPALMDVSAANATIIKHGPYARAELGALFESYDISLVLIPSICPETFCYAASEAILLGYPVICFDLGAQAERICRYGCGWVLPGNSEKEIIKLLRELNENPDAVAEKSLLTRNYVPKDEAEHFACFRALIDKTIR